MEQLLKQLNTYWHSSSDERYLGENPACYQVLDDLEKRFEGMQDSEIEKVLDELPVEQIEQLQSIFEDLVDERKVFLKYTD